MAVPEMVLMVVAFLMLGVIMAALFRKIPTPYTVMLFARQNKLGRSSGPVKTRTPLLSR